MPSGFYGTGRVPATLAHIVSGEEGRAHYELSMNQVRHGGRWGAGCFSAELGAGSRAILVPGPWQALFKSPAGRHRG